MPQPNSTHPIPHFPVIVHFADAPNGDAWLAIRTEDGALADVRRAPREEIGLVTNELRLVACGDLMGMCMHGDTHSSPQMGLSLIR